MKTLNVISYDVGGSGGKVQMGRFDGQRLASETVSRYHNSTIGIFSEQYWDFLKMVEARNQGVAKAAAQTSGQIASIGTTTFGNGFVLLDRRGNPFSLTYGIYPERLDPALQAVDRAIPLQELHFRTGAEIRNYITAVQAMAFRVHGEDALMEYADKLILFPDALNYTLSGVMQAECTAASVGGLYSPLQKNWDSYVMDKLNFPMSRFAPIVPCLTVQGPVREDVCARLGINRGAQVVNAAGHDTASAVYALPAMNNTVFISLGTMALIGCEVDHLIANEKTYAARLANCGSPDDHNILMSAIRCMWHLEKCREYYAARGEVIEYDQMIQWAKQVLEMQRVIDLDDDDYLSNPHDIPRLISAYCEKTGQKRIESKAELFRCLFDSIVWAVAREYAVICDASGLAPQQVYVLGGGGRNAFLMQMFADSLGCEIVVPQYEATSYGVLLAQLVALGELGGRRQVKDLICQSVETVRYTPQRSIDLSMPAKHWQDGRRRLNELGIS